MENTVANEIFRQLGGNKFVVMTGCKNFAVDKNSLSMRIPKNKSKANYLKITLNGDDTYTMVFKKITLPRFNSKTMTFTEYKESVVKTFEHIYCDQLQELFTEVTWMYTSL